MVVSIIKRMNLLKEGLWKKLKNLPERERGPVIPHCSMTILRGASLSAQAGIQTFLSGPPIRVGGKSGPPPQPAIGEGRGRGVTTENSSTKNKKLGGSYYRAAFGRSPHCAAPQTELRDPGVPEARWELRGTPLVPPGLGRSQTSGLGLDPSPTGPRQRFLDYWAVLHGPQPPD